MTHLQYFYFDLPIDLFVWFMDRYDCKIQICFHSICLWLKAEVSQFKVWLTWPVRILEEENKFIFKLKLCYCKNRLFIKMFLFYLYLWLFYLYLCICAYVYGHLCVYAHPYMQIPSVARRRHLVPWSWNYRHLWAPQHESWNPNSWLS